MKTTMKKALALLIAALLALPMQSIAFAEDAFDVITEDMAPAEEIELSVEGDDIEAPVLEQDDVLLADLDSDEQPTADEGQPVDEQQPGDEQQTEVGEPQPADEQEPADEGQSADEQPTEVGEPQPADEQEPTDDEPGEPSDDRQGEDGQPPEDEQEAGEEPTTEASLPVTVLFNIEPETAVIAVHAVADDASEDEETTDPIPAQADGSFALLPGEYAYTASAEGYIAVENIPFTVEASDAPLTINVALAPVEPEPEPEPEPETEPEPVPFNQSKTVSGVVVTVQA